MVQQIQFRKVQMQPIPFVVNAAQPHSTGLTSMAYAFRARHSYSNPETVDYGLGVYGTRAVHLMNLFIRELMIHGKFLEDDMKTGGTPAFQAFFDIQIAQQIMEDQNYYNAFAFPDKTGEIKVRLTADVAKDRIAPQTFADYLQEFIRRLRDGRCEFRLCKFSSNGCVGEPLFKEWHLREVERMLNERTGHPLDPLAQVVMESYLQQFYDDCKKMSQCSDYLDILKLREDYNRIMEMEVQCIQ